MSLGIKKVPAVQYQPPAKMCIGRTEVDSEIVRRIVSIARANLLSMKAREGKMFPASDQAVIDACSKIDFENSLWRLP